MARLATNFPEEGASGFFVNQNCMDSDLCRQIAPQFFSSVHPGNNGFTYIQRQSATVEEYLAYFEAVRSSAVEEIDFDSTGAANGFEDSI
jgi:ferredoxin